jgi:hypothetical protein
LPRPMLAPSASSLSSRCATTAVSYFFNELARGVTADRAPTYPAADLRRTPL